jgi:hypothetical protein
MGVHNNARLVDIRAISEQIRKPVDRWMNASIEIVAPDINGGVYDRATNTKTRNPQVMWTGPARIQAVRWPNVATARQAAMALREVIFHLPLDTDEEFPLYIPQGWRVRVLDGGLSPQFENSLFVITTTINSSYDWDRRIETTMDQGAPIDNG